MRERFQREPLPDELAAQRRAWPLVRTAFEEREPVSWPTRHLRLLVAAALVTALVAAAASPPGRAVLHSIRKAVGVEQTEEALFSLPASGRLLVTSRGGAWIVQADGSRRRLGSYREASWSPHGLFVAATRRNELAALDPKGRVRWALSRPSVRFPRWTGTRSDTRIAYLTRSRLHVVAGDGTGDRDIAGAAAVAPAWRPGTRTLAYATPTGSVLVYDVDQEEIAWRTKAGEIPTKLEWSSDGGRLIVLRPHALRVYDRGGRAVGRDDPSEGWPDVDASFRPGSSEVAVVRQHGSQSDVFLLANGRLLFNGTGIFERLAWSPNGRWALVGWPTVNQWVFVRRAGGRRIVAVSQIGREFRGFPHVEGWCCR